MIEVHEHAENVAEAIAAGKAAQFYWLGYPEDIKRKYPMGDAWYTERQGDCIGMITPEGTPESELPRMALAWIAFRWRRLP